MHSFLIHKMTTPGDFSFLGERSFERPMLADAYQAVTAAGLWDFFKLEAPPEDKGYMFWDSPELKRVEQHMKLLDQHSGASYGWTMRNMQAIARDGWDSYQRRFK